MAPKSRHNHNNPQDRQVQLSKALSTLLRHRATQDRVPISSDGFVRCSDVLKWHRLKSLGASFEEVLGVVEENLKPGQKGRFGLKYSGNGNGVEVMGGEEGEGVEAEDVDGECAQRTETEKALEEFTSNADIDPAHFLIRAVQGHSIKDLDAEALLTSIKLENVPDTVVHGTFYGAWESIVNSGGLKIMGRNHVHCATGPGLREVLPDANGQGGQGGDGNEEVERRLIENKVRSGMRSDAQILIYIDIRRALVAGVPFWRSENGVILTEGKQSGDGGEKVLGMEYWDVVVEVKADLGVLWRYGEGVVKELPKELASRGVPRGKGGGGRGRGRGRGRGKGGSGKPKLMVERGDVE